MLTDQRPNWLGIAANLVSGWSQSRQLVLTELSHF